MNWLETVIIAIVEGLTEFLPVSSTGHMIITQNLLGIKQGDPVKVTVDGADEDTAFAAIEAFLKANF